MSENPNEFERGRPRERSATVTAHSRRSLDLQSIVVRYENGTDRCTVAPRECADGERTTVWLSADLDAFVDLEEAR